MKFEPMEFERIKAGQERLSQVFSDEFAFAIPTYQRPYAWEKEQAEALLDDVLNALREAIETKDESHIFLAASFSSNNPARTRRKWSMASNG